MWFSKVNEIHYAMKREIIWRKNNNGIANTIGIQYFRTCNGYYTLIISNIPAAARLKI